MMIWLLIKKFPFRINFIFKIILVHVRDFLHFKNVFVLFLFNVIVGGKDSRSMFFLRVDVA